MSDKRVLNNRKDPMPKKRAGDTYLSVAELAKKLGVHRTTVNSWISDGSVKAVRMGVKPRSPYLIPKDEVDRIMESVGLLEQ